MNTKHATGQGVIANINIKMVFGVISILTLLASPRIYAKAKTQDNIKLYLTCYSVDEAHSLRYPESDFIINELDQSFGIELTFFLMPGTNKRVVHFKKERTLIENAQEVSEYFFSTLGRYNNQLGPKNLYKFMVRDELGNKAKFQLRKSVLSLNNYQTYSLSALNKNAYGLLRAEWPVAKKNDYEPLFICAAEQYWEALEEEQIKACL